MKQTTDNTIRTIMRRMAAPFAIIAMALAIVAGASSCSKDNKMTNQVFLDIDDNGTDADLVASYTLTPSNLLNVPTEYFINVNTPRPATLILSFECDSAVHWDFNHVPEFATVRPASGRGSSKATLIVSANESGTRRTGQFEMLLIQRDKEGKEQARLSHTFNLSQQ